jgi:branched-subunit amino acid aminotransferase/4-amino-4-deoxychorismate lyase
MQTAPADTVLEGISRVRVIQACKQLGIRVNETAPDPRERASWKEAFVCNCLRMLQPIGSIECASGAIYSSGVFVRGLCSNLKKFT